MTNATTERTPRATGPMMHRQDQGQRGALSVAHTVLLGLGGLRLPGQIQGGGWRGLNFLNKI